MCSDRVRTATATPPLPESVRAPSASTTETPCPEASDAANTPSPTGGETCSAKTAYMEETPQDCSRAAALNANATSPAMKTTRDSTAQRGTSGTTSKNDSVRTSNPSRTTSAYEDTGVPHDAYGEAVATQDIIPILVGRLSSLETRRREAGRKDRAKVIQALMRQLSKLEPIVNDIVADT